MNVLKEITDKLSIFKNFYDYVRIIETHSFTALDCENSELNVCLDSNFHCISDTERCTDCLAKKAFLTQKTFQKIELIDNKAYLHTLSPFSLENTEYVAEFFKDITNNLYFSELNSTTPMAEFLTNLKDMANKDSLTKAYNRHFLNEKFKNKFQNKFTEPVSLIMIDLDHFKNINDKYGHIIGDKILQKFSKLIFKLLNNTSYFCRFGGEEFLIFLDNVPLNRAISLANSIKKHLNTIPFIVNNIEISLSCSMGIYTSFYNCTTLEDLLKKADENLYIAKASGRNTIIF